MRENCKARLNDWHAIRIIKTLFQPNWQWYEARRMGWKKTILSRQWWMLVLWSLDLYIKAGIWYLQDFSMVIDEYIYSEIVKVLKDMRLYVLSFYPSSFPTRFPLSSSSFSHSWSMHSAHLVPNFLKLEKSTFGGRSQIVTTWGGHRTRLCSSGTQNSNSLSRPTTHPSLMTRRTGSCPWVAFRCLATMSAMS